MQNPIFVSFQHKRQSVRHHNHSRSAIMSFFDRRWSAFRSHDNRDNFLLLVTQLGNCDVQSHSPSQWSLISHHLSSTFATLWPNQFLCFSQLRTFFIDLYKCEVSKRKPDLQLFFHGFSLYLNCVFYKSECERGGTYFGMYFISGLSVNVTIYVRSKSLF